MIKGFPSEQKVINVSNTKRTKEKYATVNPVGAGRHALDVFPKALAPLQAVDYIPEGGSTTSLQFTAHSFKLGDVVRFTAGDYEGTEVSVVDVDTNTIYFGFKFSTALSAVDTCVIARPITLTIDSDGNLSTSSGPIQFIKNSIVQQVVEDTATPANNAPLPVKLTGVTGDVNITAGDLNVQLSDQGVNADVVRLGDGTNQQGFNASSEALSHDQDVLDELVLQKALLTSLEGKDFASETTLATRSSEATLATRASEATLATRASEATLATRASEATSAAILAKIIAAPSTEAKQDTIITALGNLLAKSSEIKSVIDSYYLANPTIPTATRLLTVTVPALSTAYELEIFTKSGDNFTAYDASVAGNVIGRFTQAGARIPVNLVAGVEVYLQSDTGLDIIASDLTINLIGV